MNSRQEVLDDGSIALKEPVQLPDVLDVLIVGGGPCGTAAAMRAKELGLTALVIELDDVLKRIRDYAKDKLILPGFGGGD
ncbi:MAG: NAD(P)-binding domain-containing protein, partial [Candidatus Eiseniibacteriota bacterium]